MINYWLARYLSVMYKYSILMYLVLVDDDNGKSTSGLLSNIQCQ